jgi:transposase
MTLAATGFIPTDAVALSPRQEVEVLAKAERRRFTVEYKRRILQEADACTRPGELGALLRREGLYSSHLASWRAARARGEFKGLSAKKRGPKARPVPAEAKRILVLERENRRLRARAERAEALVELQKKVAALLGNDLPPSGEER